MKNEIGSDKIPIIADEVMNMARNSVLVNLRFISSAFNKVKYLQYHGSISVDGEFMRYDPLYILQNYRMSRQAPPHYYLHMLLHCIFRHFFIGTLVNKVYWDLACDIAVESIILELDMDCCRNEAQIEQRAILEKLSAKAGKMTAENLYRYFLSGGLSKWNLTKVRRAFRCDDHSIWYEQAEGGKKLGQEADETGMPVAAAVSANGEASDGSADGEQGSAMKHEIRRLRELREEWKQISERIEVDLEVFSRRYGSESGNLIQNLRSVNRDRRDYSEFLKKFAVPTESMGVNDQEFDYIFYTYGLNIYGNMPLIEPLEYKEVKSIRTFVVAIDTSGSVKNELVHRFMEHTYNILSSQDSFSSRAELFLIQCDTEIQEVVKITDREGLERYMRTTKLKGFGGTDFRPVFKHVEKMVASGEMEEPEGLIYFTDGKGVFPGAQPPYRTAFIFVDDECEDIKVPAWAIRQVFREEEI